MPVKQTKVCGFSVGCYKSSSLKEDLITYLKGKDKAFVAKVNSEFLLRGLEDYKFGEILNTTSINIADGVSVLWAARYLTLPVSRLEFVRSFQAVWQMVYTGASLVFRPKYCLNPIPERFPGVSALYLMLEAAMEVGTSAYFFGAEDDVIQKAVANIKNKYPKLQVAGYHEGWHYEDDQIIEDVNKSEARFLIVALGSPKQEYWIRDNLPKLTSVRVAVGEGGSLDFIAGSSRRAPGWMQQLGVEWFWRLFMNKSKSGTGSRVKRVWQAVPVFMWTALKYKLRDTD